MQNIQKHALLIASSSKRYITKKQVRGNPLKGVREDIEGFKKKFQFDSNHYIESSNDEAILLPKQTIKNWLRKYLNKKFYQHFLFYSGHGHEDGDWKIDTFQHPSGDRLSLFELVEIWNESKISKNSHLFIFMDSCFSGQWCYRLAQMNEKSISIFASCKNNQQARDYNGGLFFNCLFGLLQRFEYNYEFLISYQNPTYIHNSQFAGELCKEDIKLLNIQIRNVVKIGQSRGSLTQFQTGENQMIEKLSDCLQKQEKMQKEIKAEEWVDSKCFHFKKCILNKNSILAQSQAFIFGRRRISSQYSFTVRFQNWENGGSLGIIDIQYRNKSQFNPNHFPNFICYFNNKHCWDGKQWTPQQGNGFKVGEQVSVIVDLYQWSIQWKVNQKSRFKLFTQRFMDRNIEWVPYVCLSNQGDRVILINENQPIYYV